MNDSDNRSTIFFGGLIVLVVIGGLCLKALQALFKELEKTFDAFDKMASSFLGALWGAAQVTFFAALIILCASAAIYFSYRYIKMVRNATDVQKAIDYSINTYQYKMEEVVREFQTGNEKRIKNLEYELRKALSERAVATMPQLESTAPASTTKEKTTALPAPTVPAERSTTANEGAPINTVSNPY